MESWTQGAGIALVAVVLADIFLTVLYARGGAGLLTPYLNSATWWLFRGLGGALPSGGARLMSFAGPMILVLTIVVWVLLLVLGFALVAWPALGSAIKTSHGSTPTDFGAALYYSGYTLTTLGFGDLVPKTGGYRLLTVFIAATGFSVLTLSLTYFMSVYSALVERNTFALKLHHSTAETGDPAEWLARLGAGGKLDAAASTQVDNIASHMLRLLETHHAYPVLHYFRAPEPEYAMARLGLLALGTATLARTVIEREASRSFVEGTALTALWGGSLRLFKETANDFLPRHAVKTAASGEHDREEAWRERFADAHRRLSAASLRVTSDAAAGADAYVALRREWDAHLRAFAAHMAHPWHEIAPCEKGGGGALSTRPTAG